MTGNLIKVILISFSSYNVYDFMEGSLRMILLVLRKIIA